MLPETQPCMLSRMDDLVPANFMTLVALPSRSASGKKDQPCSDTPRDGGNFLRNALSGYMVLASQSTLTQTKMLLGDRIYGTINSDAFFH